MPLRSFRIFAMLLALTPFAPAQKPTPAQTLAPTPPMGWNSWDAYGLTITEQQFRDNVDILAKTLKPFGWQYAVIDEGWFLKNPLERPTPNALTYEIDPNGRYIPVPDRFPSALTGTTNTGFAAIGQYVHAQGLKFGIHIVRGIPRQSVTQNLPIATSKFRASDAADTSDACPWDPTNWGVKDTPAGQAWYDSLLAQYSAWGVDFLKVDCISDHPYKPAEINMLHRAIHKTGRPILLSLSPGPTSPGLVKQIQPVAQMWRISDDIWDYWLNPAPWPRSLHSQFELVAGWAPFAAPGSWPDADMLPFGYLGPVPGYGRPRETRLTHDEQQTMLTLWSIACSPLILGANLTHLDEWTITLLTNPAVIKLDQSSHDARQVASEGGVITWTASADGPKGSGDPSSPTRYLAFFNLSEKPQKVSHPFTFYNLPSPTYRATDLWLHTNLPTAPSITLTLPPHASTLLELHPN